MIGNGNPIQAELEADLLWLCKQLIKMVAGAYPGTQKGVVKMNFLQRVGASVPEWQDQMLAFGSLEKRGIAKRVEASTDMEGRPCFRILVDVEKLQKEFVSRIPEPAKPLQFDSKSGTLKWGMTSHLFGRKTIAYGLLRTLFENPDQWLSPIQISLELTKIGIGARNAKQILDAYDGIRRQFKTGKNGNFRIRRSEGSLRLEKKGLSKITGE